MYVKNVEYALCTPKIIKLKIVSQWRYFKLLKLVESMIIVETAINWHNIWHPRSNLTFYYHITCNKAYKINK